MIPGFQKKAAGDPPWMAWAGRAGLALVVVAVAIIAGMQVAEPDKRVLQVIAAGLVVLLAFRSASISALVLTVLMLPFPKGASYGSTNVAFIALLFIVWLFRVSTKRAEPPAGTSLDIPILGLVMAYALSFYNVQPGHMSLAWGQFNRFLTYVFLLYMVVNVVRTSADVAKIFTAQAISCFLVCLFGIYEQLRPGTAIVPGWIDFSQTFKSMGQGVRIGSTFLDYELFGEYCGLNLIMQMFLFIRAKSATRRFLIVGVMLLTFYCLFATVTRGALISFMSGLLYLAWLSRSRLNFVRLTTAAILAMTLLVAGDFIVSHYTNSFSTFERLLDTQIKDGMPDSRAPAWKAVMVEIEKQPIIGHGPYYSLERGLGLEWWPHNVYLYYAYIVGIVGLACYLWLLFRLWTASPPRAASLGSGSYVDGATLVLRVMMLMFVIDQLKIDYLRNGTYSFFVWFLFGLIYATNQVARREHLALVTAAPAMGASEDTRLHASVSSTPAVRRLAVSPTPAVSGR